MGNNSSSNKPGQESSVNGHDDVYGPHSYRDYIFTRRPQGAKAKRFVGFLSLDILALYIVLGILKNLNSGKEIIALIVGVWYLGARAVTITMKGISFYGKNSDSIKKGIKNLKDLFKS